MEFHFHPDPGPFRGAIVDRKAPDNLTLERITGDFLLLWARDP